MEPTALPARFAELAASRTLPRCTCAAASFVRRAYVINLDHRVHGKVEFCDSGFAIMVAKAPSGPSGSQE